MATGGIRDEVRALFPDARVVPLAPDASSRRFARIERPDGATAVVMDYGAPFDGETDDLVLQRIFVEAGLPCAAVLDARPDPGCIVWEDLGPTMAEERLGRDGDPGIWSRAVDLAARIAVDGTPVLAASPRADGPALDAERFAYEMSFFARHFAAGRGVAEADVREPLHELSERAARGPRVLCHRDFHCRNLVVAADGRLVPVDLQDARWGPDGYDLASWVWDAYQDRPDAWVGPAIERYRERRGSDEPATEFRRRLDTLAAQRMLKALGTFGYQASLGHGRYRTAVPRTCARLRALLPTIEGGPELAARLAPALAEN